MSNGENVFGFKAEQGTVLYFCLEDNYERIQQRVFSMTDDLTNKVHFSKSACSINDGKFIKFVMPYGAQNDV